jgi:hypothetical protein
LFAVSGNGVLAFDRRTGSLLKSSVGHHKKNIYCISVAAEANLLATGAYPPSH